VDFNLKTAQAFARNGQIDQWVDAYLTTGTWKNAGLSEGLKLEKRWWTAPVYVSLDSIKRCCGPEPEMLYRQELASWERRVTKIADSLADITELPPLIVNYQDGEYIISDGNHRHEALKRKGWTQCWVIIWFTSEADFKASAYYQKKA